MKVLIGYSGNTADYISFGEVASCVPFSELLEIVRVEMAIRKNHPEGHYNFNGVPQDMMERAFKEIGDRF